MKKSIAFSLSAFLIAAFLVAGPASAQKTNKLYYYPVKSAMVEYVYSGQTTGKETMYLDDNGRSSARYSQLTTKSLGSSTTTDQISIQKDTTIYSIDMLTKTGSKTTFKMDKKEMEDWAKTAEQMWNDMGFKKTGQGVILGKNCDIWEGMSTKIWVWQNLALKTEMSMLGKTTIEAVKVETNVSIDKSRFAVPAGITITEQHINVADPVLDTLGKELQKGLNELKGMFNKKK